MEQKERQLDQSKAEMTAYLDKMHFLKMTTTNVKTGEIIVGDSIFDKFVRQQLKAYVEPVRKGIPKGQLIGISTPKYFVSLLMLTNLSIKTIAAGLKLKYGVVLVWRTEEAFKKQIEQNCKDFADYLIKTLIEEKKIAELGYWEARRVLEELDAEFKFYSPLLNDAIEKALAVVGDAELEAIKEGKVGLSFYFLEIKYGKEATDIFGDHLLLSICITLLKKPNLSKKAKAQVISTLERLRNSKVKLLPEEIQRVVNQDKDDKEFKPIT